MNLAQLFFFLCGINEGLSNSPKWKKPVIRVCEGGEKKNYSWAKSDVPRPFEDHNTRLDS